MKQSNDEYVVRTNDEHEILRCLVGSRAYGTYIEDPPSDWDYKGIYISSKEQVVGISPELKTKRFSPDDHNYSLRHFAHLATKCVPNVVELLWCDDDCVVLSTEEGRKLRDHRSLFLSKRCIAPYIGYAQGQIHKASIVPTNRGQGRQDLVHTYGYDVKYAMHTIRLLQTAQEILTEGIIRVRRPNRDFLISIRQGQAFKTYNEFKKFAMDLIQSLKPLEDKCDLPPSPNMRLVNKLIIEIQEQYWLTI